jgi:riboflavin transporter FmnP
MRFKTKDLVTASVLLALGVILPMIIHMTGINGAVFLPMHIPVLISGLIVGSHLGLIIGILSPIINNLLTGMPPVPVLWTMLVELSLYGFMSGYLYKKVKMTLVPSLILSMIVGRIGGALAILLLGKGFGLAVKPIGMYVKGITLTSIPGILIQIIIIPIIVNAYERNKNSVEW